MFNLVKLIYWKVITTDKHHKSYINNTKKRYNQVICDYSVGYIVEFDHIYIYCNIDYYYSVQYMIT